MGTALSAAAKVLLIRSHSKAKNDQKIQKEIKIVPTFIKEAFKCNRFIMSPRPRCVICFRIVHHQTEISLKGKPVGI